MTDTPHVTGAVARTLQALRTERGWSLDQLAARSGVSKGVLVALEQERSNPSLATLARISDAFGVPVTRLVEISDEPAVRVWDASQERVLWQGPAGGTGTIIAATEPPWAVELWRWEVQPGETFGGYPHRAGHPRDGLGRAGHAHPHRGRRQHQVRPGECARFSGGRRHGYANQGCEPVRMTMVVVVPPAAS